jgi:DNA helicase HerA-like ATPase
MNTQNPLLIGKTLDGVEVALRPGMANRHGLVAGATGTGKTVTLQALAERFSRLGVPVFTADIKGDLSGIAAPGQLSPRIQDRLTKIGVQNYQPRPCPVLFWDVYGKSGHPVRTTISEMGPLLLGRVLQLNETQEQVLQIVFKLADDQGLLLLDSKDLKVLLSWVSDNLSSLKGDYGNIAPATIATIQRNLMTLTEAGGEIFFGEPALQLEHIQQRDFSGNGVISLLDATQLLLDPRLYSTFLLWLLSELFERLPEVGDMEKPKLVFFFDEAHLLFKDASSSLISRIEQVVRLIRSKGVGVYFVTQNPADIPESVLAQLGNRFQHALRAYTPSEQKAVRTAAQSFRANPKFETQNVISELEVGEALVSVLDEQGRPTMVERVFIAPPESQIGILGSDQRKEVYSRSPLRGTYENMVDRESAYEVLKKRQTEATAQSQSAPAPQSDSGGGMLSGLFGGGNGRRQGVGEALVKSIVRSAGSSLGRQIIRGFLGSIDRGLRR